MWKYVMKEEEDISVMKAVYLVISNHRRQLNDVYHANEICSWTLLLRISSAFKILRLVVLSNACIEWPISKAMRFSVSTTRIQCQARKILEIMGPPRFFPKQHPQLKILRQ